MIKKKISEVDEKIIDLEIEKSKIHREDSLLVLNKAMFLYFSFLIMAIIGKLNNLISDNLFNFLIMGGIIILVIGILPYLKFMRAESKKIDYLIEKLRRGQ